MIRMRSLVALTLLALLTGCSSKPELPARFPVTGTVTMGGRPVEGARIVFIPTTPGLNAASAISDKDGKYSLTTFEAGDGAQPGSYGIKVAKYDSKPGAAPPPTDAAPVSYEDESKLQFAPDEKPTPQARNSLPKKFDSPITSKLTHTVPEGPSTYDIKLD